MIVVLRNAIGTLSSRHAAQRFVKCSCTQHCALAPPALPTGAGSFLSRANLCMTVRHSNDRRTTRIQNPALVAGSPPIAGQVFKPPLQHQAAHLFGALN